MVLQAERPVMAVGKRLERLNQSLGGSRGVTSGVDENAAFEQPIGVVQVEEGDRRQPHVGQRFDSVVDDAEMVMPEIGARGIEPREPSVGWQNRGDVGALGAIAKYAGEGEVVIAGGAAMFLGDDVFDLASEEGVVLMDEAVFAEPLGAPGDEAAGDGRGCSCSLRSLAGPRLGEPHQVFEFEVVVELNALVRGERPRFFSLDQAGDTVAGSLGGGPCGHMAGCGTTGDELDNFFVGACHREDYT